jgi:hypothetical protein
MAPFWPQGAFLMSLDAVEASEATITGANERVL